MSADEKEFPFENERITSRENPDWGYARNLRAVLMTTSAEWVQSCASSRLTAAGSEFIAPNRDYPYEGLSFSQDGENWKFIDAIALSVRSRDGRHLQLESRKSEPDVEVNPWNVTYHYQTANLPSDDPFAKLAVSVTYRLHSATDALKGASGEVRVSFPGLTEAIRSQLVLTIQPFLDIRHVFGAGDFTSYDVSFSPAEPNRIFLKRQNRRLMMHVSHGAISRLDPRVILNWIYKLGTGQRHEGVNGQGRPVTAFTPEKKDIGAFFKIETDAAADGADTILYVHCSMDGFGDPPTLDELKSISARSLEEDYQCAAEIRRKFSFCGQPEIGGAILARIAGVTRFKVAERYAAPNNERATALIPTAGAWWFKTPWFRDTFEGILNSFQVLMSLPKERSNVGEVILAALSSQHPDTGLIPNRFPEHKGAQVLYNSSDATLLCLIAAARYCSETKDARVAAAAVSTVLRILTALSRSSSAAYDGPPRIDKETALLLSTPHHSWIDTRNLSITYAGQNLKGLPSRVSPQFVMDLCDRVIPVHSVVEFLSTPRFFLPEINAQWILVLRGILSVLIPLAGENSREVSEARERVHALLEQAEKNFLAVFWNENGGCLYNVVFEDRSVADRIESESSVTAAAMLGRSIFSMAQLETIWHTVAKKLLISRNLVRYGDARLPFGIIVKNADPSIYYDDTQYHSDVIWPRSVPYLLRLLRLVNDSKTAKEIILNNLDHQMSEGAIYYNHELFSRPLGNNPEHVEATERNPVPVKNPIQFWSQWCDPIVELFGAPNPVTRSEE